MPRSIYFNRWWLFGLKIFSALGFFFPLWYLYEQQYLNLTEIALLEGIIVGMQLILEIPTGAVADIFGLKASVIIGYLIQAAACVVYVSARTFPVFLIYSTLWGLAESLKSGAEDALEYDSLKAIGKEQAYAKYKSWYSLVFQVTLAIAFIVGGSLGKISFSIPIWMTAMGLCCSAGIITLFVEPPRQRQNPSFKRYIQQFNQGWHELTRDRYTRQIALFYIAVGSISWTTNISLLSIYLGQIGYSADETGWVLGVIRIANILILMKALKRLIQPKLGSNVYWLFIGTFIVGYIPTILFPKWWAVGLIPFIMVSTTARWVVIGSYLNRHISSKNRATALSTASMVIGMIQMLIMIGPAAVMSQFGGAKVLISVLGIIGGGMTLWLMKRYQQSEITV